MIPFIASESERLSAYDRGARRMTNLSQAIMTLPSSYSVLQIQYTLSSNSSLSTSFTSAVSPVTGIVDCDLERAAAAPTADELRFVTGSERTAGALVIRPDPVYDTVSVVACTCRASALALVAPLARDLTGCFGFAGAWTEPINR